MSIPPKSYTRRALLYAVIFLLFLPVAEAISPPSLEIIPDRISVNGSFVVKADTDLNEAARMEYKIEQAYLQTDNEDSFYGSIPNIGDTWACVFSNNPEISTCGPSPYGRSFDLYGYKTYPTQEDCTESEGTWYGCIFVELIDSYGRYEGHYRNATRLIPVGDIIITPEIDVGEENVTINVHTSTPNTDVSFAIYNSNFTIFSDYQDMDKVEGSVGSLHRTSFKKTPGNYYVVFKAETEGEWGGTLFNLSIPGRIAYQGPGGVEYKNELVNITPVEWNPIINKSRHAEKSSFKITNKGNDTLYNLSVEIPEEIADYIGIELEQSVLEGKESMYFTVTIDEVEVGTSFKSVAYLLSNGTTIGSIPIDIMVTVRDACEGLNFVKAPSDVIEFDYYTIEASFLTDTTNTRTIKVTNNGEEELNSFTSVVSNSINNIIKNVNLPDKIAPGESADIEIEIEGTRAKSYLGTIIISTNVGSEKILVGVTFMDDVSSDISSLESQLEDLESYLADAPDDVQGLISDIKASIQAAKNDADSADYDSALENYNEARLKFSALSDLAYVLANEQETPSGDGTIIIIVLVVVIIAGAGFAAWYYFTKMKKGEREFGSESKIENEDELDF